MLVLGNDVCFDQSDWRHTFFFFPLSQVSEYNGDEKTERLEEQLICILIAVFSCPCLRTDGQLLFFLFPPSSDTGFIQVWTNLSELRFDLLSKSA